MKKLIIVLAALAVAGAAQAAIIANYTFDGSSAADSAAYANMTAGNFTASDTTLGFIAGTAWPGGVAADESTWGLATAQADVTKWWYFTVTPDANYSITITGLSFLYGGTQAGPKDFGWSIGGTYYDPTAFPHTLTLSAQGPFNSSAVSVTITEATTIAIQAWNATSTGNFRVDNVVLNGTVSSIPEPATMGLLGLGALAMVLRRKMRK